jgi:hypothetical protein
MAKVIVIEECTQCPFFQDAYVPYGMMREHCKKSNKSVPWVPGGTKNRGSYPIPSFCELKDFEPKDEVGKAECISERSPDGNHHYKGGSKYCYHCGLNKNYS